VHYYSFDAFQSSGLVGEFAYIGGQGVTEKFPTILFLDSYLTRLMTDFLDNIKKGLCELFLPFICYERQPFSIQ